MKINNILYKKFIIIINTILLSLFVGCSGLSSYITSNNDDKSELIQEYLPNNNTGINDIDKLLVSRYRAPGVIQTNDETTYTLETSGFHFICMPVITDNTLKASNVIVDQNIIGIFSFDSSKQSFVYLIRLSNGQIFGNDFTIDTGMGFVVKTSDYTTIKFTGIPINTTNINLVQGFNYVGVGTEVNSISALIYANNNLDSVFGWDDSTQSFNPLIRLQNGSVFGKDFKLVKNLGYFIKSKYSFTINISYFNDPWKIIDLGNDVKMTFRWIEPGNFDIGALSNDTYKQDDEIPQHKVIISKGFFISDCECTQAQWYAVMGTRPSNYNYPVDYLRPVENISWNDCQNFINILNNKNLGIGTFRLPREAEWEYSCRAGTTTMYWHGDDSYLSEWYSSVSYSSPITHTVRTKLQNNFELYDMGGNVREWCDDWYNSKYYTYNNIIDPKGPNSGSEKVIRGSSILNLRYRSSDRDKGDPSYKYKDLGFRLVIEP